MTEPACGATEHVESEYWVCLMRLCGDLPVAKLKAVIIDGVEHDRTHREFYVCSYHFESMNQSSASKRVIWELL